MSESSLLARSHVENIWKSRATKTADSGTVLAAPPIPPSSFDDEVGQTFSGYSRVGPPVVDSEGVTYLEYETRHAAFPARVTTATLWLMKIDVDRLHSSGRVGQGSLGGWPP